MTTSKEIKKALEQFIVDEINDLKSDLKTTIKNNSPVKTGKLRSSWEETQDITKVGQDAKVGTDVHYAEYLEDGTPKMAPRGFVNLSITKELNRRR